MILKKEYMQVGNWWLQVGNQSFFLKLYFSNDMHRDQS